MYLWHLTSFFSNWNQLQGLQTREREWMANIFFSFDKWNHNKSGHRKIWNAHGTDAIEVDGKNKMKIKDARRRNIRKCLLSKNGKEHQINILACIVCTTSHSHTNSLNVHGLRKQANDRLQMQYKNQPHTIVIGMGTNQIITKRIEKFLQNNCSIVQVV